MFQLRARPATRGQAASLRRLLDDDRELDLAGLLVVYDRSLAILDTLHHSGRIHGAVSADAIHIGADGAVTLDEPTAAPRGADQPLIFEVQGSAALSRAALRDVRALTLAMVDALTHGAAGSRIPLAARELVRRGLGDDADVPAPTGDLRADTDEAGRAFFGARWREAGVAALAQAASALVGETVSGGPGRRARRGLAGVAIGAGLLLAAPTLVGRSLAADPAVNGQARQAGVSSATVGSPAATLVGPATTDAAGGSQLSTGPSVSPSPGSSNTRRRRAATANTAVTPRHGATAQLTPSPAPASASAKPGPTAAGTPSATPSATASPTATATPSPTPTPKPTASPTAKPTATPTATPTPKPTPKPTP